MKMNYFVFGTNDMKNAIGFYDALFEDTGVKKMHSGGRMTLWGNEDFMFAVAEPFDQEPAANGNGTMLGLNIDSPEEIENLLNKALKMGGVSEGEPGMRSGRYSAYVRDLDSNKICFFK